MLTLVSAFKDDNCNSFAVFDGECCVGHVMHTQQSPQGKPWFWTIFARGVPSMPDRGYAETRKRAMAEFKARWLN
jgi:hypothetical protein